MSLLSTHSRILWGLQVKHGTKEAVKFENLSLYLLDCPMPTRHQTHKDHVHPVLMMGSCWVCLIVLRLGTEPNQRKLSTSAP